MVEFLVTAAVELILEKAFSLAANEFAIASGYKKSLTILYNKLEKSRGFLQDAERRNSTQAAVKVWMKQLTDVVSEADDLLDEVQYEVLRKEVKKRDTTSKRRRLPSLKKLSLRSKMGHKIEKINKTLSEMNTEALQLRLQSEAQASPPNSLPRQTHPYLDKKIVGRKEEKQEILNLLTESKKEEKLIIIPVVGMGGIGKTALAKLIYNDPKIEKRFDVKAWSCVSSEVHITSLLKMSYESLTRKPWNLPINMVLLIEKLQEELGLKRYLLVLDDVWDKGREYWDDFRSCMEKVNSHNGNAIIVTTRKLEIGTNDMKKNSRKLQGLSDEDGWRMFKEIANLLPSSELEEIGRNIVKKCSGLPLLIRVIGSKLQNESDKDEWLFVQENMVQGEEESDILKNLKLSFDGLPTSTSKKCFAYCSIFEKDAFMKKEELVQLWMALGLLQVDGTRNRDTEEVGNEIFKILISNSLFQDVELDRHGDVYSCKMHDLVHDLSIDVSGGESCLMDPTKEKDMSRVKHLSLYQEVDNNLLKDMASRTRHTLFLRGVATKISFQGFKCLRILKLSDTALTVMHDSFGDLVHLRYLDLSSTGIEVLPESITKLYQLQTLKLLCYKFKKFPEGMRNLISLRHIEFGDDVISPRDVGQLTSLRTLSSFGVGREKGCQIGELGSLKHLGGKLGITNLEEVGSKEEASKSDLVGKKNVYKIKLCWKEKESNEGARQKDKDILEGLQTNANVKSLTIKNYSSDCFPEWVMDMSTNIGGKWIPLDKLVDVTLSGCGNVLSLPTVWNLPLLRDLVLSDMDSLTSLSSSVGQGSSEPVSRSLRKLELCRMKRLEKWRDAATNSSTMISPVLKTLCIWDCPKIVVLDEHYPHPLVDLEILNCRNLESIRSLQGLTSLESLIIRGCDSLLGIPDLHNLGGSLRDLEIVRCDKLPSMPRGIDSLTLLRTLVLGPFLKELDCFPSLKGLEKLSNLRSLVLNGCHHWETIPEEVKHLTSLEALHIWRFGIREIPIWLTNMSSIKSIDFDRCPRLDADIVSKGAPRKAEFVCLDLTMLR